MCTRFTIKKCWASRGNFLFYTCSLISFNSHLIPGALTKFDVNMLQCSSWRTNPVCNYWQHWSGYQLITLWLVEMVKTAFRRLAIFSYALLDQQVRLSAHNSYFMNHIMNLLLKLLFQLLGIICKGAFEIVMSAPALCHIHLRHA